MMGPGFMGGIEAPATAPPVLWPMRPEIEVLGGNQRS
jgi:hypothetical protein